MNGKKRIFVILAFLILSFLLIIYGASRNQARFTVTFMDGYNDKVIDKQIITSGDDVEVPEAPKHDSFVFGGWYLYGSKDTLITKFENIEKDLKVEARYKSDRNKNGIADDIDTYYTVRFIDGVTSTILKTESVLVGMGATAPMANVHTNYTFAGWNREYSNIQNNLDVLSIYTRENVLTMYTLNFYNKEGEIFTTQNIANGNASASVEVPKYEGYTFEGWYLDTNHTERYELGSIVSGNLNIYGNWNINNYEVKINANGGTATGGDGPAETEINANYGEKIILPGAERTYIVTYHGNPEEGTTVREPHGVNATLLGWCKGDTLTCLPENLIAPYTEIEVTENVVFVAYWGESEDKITLDTASRNKTPGLEFTLNGWALTNDAEVKDYNAGQSIILKDNLDLYALWDSTIREYTITFDSDGGSEIEPLTLNYNDEVDLSERIPTKTGYTFKGWKLVGEGSIPERMPENGFEVIADWEIDKYTIKFMDGGIELTNLTITQDYNTNITKPADLSREGYTFSWDQTIPTVMPAKNMIINAVWTVNSYKLIFKDGETILSEETKNYGESITAPENLAKEGYTFNWDQIIPIVMPARDLTINTIWTIKEYNISFNHKVGLVEWEIGKIKIPYGTIPTNEIPNVQLPVPTGHKVIWRTANGTEWNLATDIVKNDLKLYADIKPISYTIKFNFEDGSNIVKTANFGEIINAPENTEKLGYTCKWNLFDKILVNENKEITETCTKNNYILVIDAFYTYIKLPWPFKGEKEIEKLPEIHFLKYNELKNIPNPTRKGYEFAGWTLTGEGSSMDGTTFTMGHENATLKANWNEKSKYMISFNSNGGSSVATATNLSKNSLVTKPIDPIKEGHDFAGWYKEETLENEWNFTTDKIISNITLYAKWNVRKYTLTFVDTDGTVITKTADWNTTLEDIPAVTQKTGNTCIWNNIPVIVTEDLKITSSCIKNNYELTINPNSGTWGGTTPQTLEYEATMTITSPTREGYIFDGWTLIGTGSSINGTTFTMGYENATLTANWIINQYVITFVNTDGTSTNVGVSHGDTIIPTPVLKEKSGYTCIWKNVPSVATNSITITTECTKNSYNLSIYLNGGTWTGTTSQTLEYEATMTITNPTREGYIFDGWTLIGTGSSINGTTFTMGYENATLTAKWTENTPVVQNHTLTIVVSGGNVDYKINGLLTKNTNSIVHTFPSDVDINLTEIKGNNDKKTLTLKFKGNTVILNENNSFSVGKLTGDEILEINIENKIQ